MLDNIEKKILAFILSFFMMFSNIINVFGYEWDLDIPPIINENFENVTDNLQLCVMLPFSKRDFTEF